MRKLNPVPQDPRTDPVSLASAAVHSLMQTLPAGTACCMGLVLMVMMTGRLGHTKGSLARAVFPCVVHLRWGWHRVERAMERGKFSLDACGDRALDWCLAPLPVASVCLGPEERAVTAVDTSTMARLRAGPRLALAGKGSGHRAGRAVRANSVAVITSVVMMRGVRVGLVRRARFGVSGQEAVERLCTDLPHTDRKRLIVVDAGMATQEQCAAATAQDALRGRLRLHGTLRCAPAPPPGKPGRPPVHGAGLHLGRDPPAVAPEEERTSAGEAGDIRLRRWTMLHSEEFPTTLLDVVRMDDPAYDKPLLVGTTAREVRTDACRLASQPRWPVEPNCFVAQDTAAREMPRAWTATARERRSSVVLVVGALLQAIAAVCTPQARGPWDRKPVRSGGRLAHYVDLHAWRFSTLALKGIAPRNDRKNPKALDINDLEEPEAA